MLLLNEIQTHVIPYITPVTITAFVMMYLIGASICARLKYKQILEAGSGGMTEKQNKAVTNVVVFFMSMMWPVVLAIHIVYYAAYAVGFVLYWLIMPREAK